MIDDLKGILNDYLKLKYCMQQTDRIISTKKSMSNDDSVI